VVQASISRSKIRLKKPRPPLTFQWLEGEPPPPRRRQTQYVFGLMEIGDSVQVNRPTFVARAALRNFSKKQPDWRFAIRKIDAASCRVWRTA
jgi:hypothetical protein